jgi:biopolymer transport protein ExbB/TolQ
MFEIVKSGGLMMVPLILCSIIAAAIILERLWTLQKSRVVPPELAEKVWRWVESRQIRKSTSWRCGRIRRSGRSWRRASPTGTASAR